jgi:hypothetical protein
VANWRFYSNVAIPDTLSASINNSATSIVTGSGAPSGYPTSFPFAVRLEPGTSNEEVVIVNSGAGTSGSPWVVTRASDGTTAKSHASGVALAHGMSATDLTTAANHYSQGSGSGVHGLPASAWATSGFATLFETTTTSGQASFSWSSIPQTYKHLMVIGQGRLVETSVQSDDVSVTFNGDSSAVYSYLTNLTSNPGGTMTGPSAGTGFASGQGPLFRFTASQGGVAANPGGGMAMIPNYTGTTFNKTWYVLSGGGNGSNSFVDLRVRVGVYAPSTQAAITSMSIIAPTGGFVTNCVFGLYGFG